ncbi:DMT family transporter [Candidatus Woesearchaeota archaeon]|nr:DMT family transporter [Candidatus Woesearchaeota archaeon]
MDWFIFAILTALLTGIQSIVQKKVLFKEHAMSFSATLAVVIAFITLPFLFIVDFSLIPGIAWVVMYFTSVLGSIAFLLIAKAVRHMDMSSSSPLLVIGPAFTALVAWILLGENITFQHMIGIFLLIVGSYVLELKPHHGLFEPVRVFIRSKYIHYIVLALILYALCASGDRFVLGSSNIGVSAESYLAIIHFFLAINYLIMISVFHDGVREIKDGLKRNGWWVLLIAALTFGYRYFQAQAVKLVNVALVSAIKRLAALFSTIIGGELFHEKNLLRKSIACVVMLGGALLVIL